MSHLLHQQRQSQESHSVLSQAQIAPLPRTLQDLLPEDPVQGGQPGSSADRRADGLNSELRYFEQRRRAAGTPAQSADLLPEVAKSEERERRDKRSGCSIQSKSCK